MITSKIEEPWKIVFYSSKVEEDIFDLPVGIRAKLSKILDMIEDFGPNLGKPYTASMGDGLFEIRVKAKEGIGRVFYCLVINREVTLLHSFVKKSQKTPKKELALAKKRKKEIS
jgi:phage-related protein